MSQAEDAMPETDIPRSLFPLDGKRRLYGENIIVEHFLILCVFMQLLYQYIKLQYSYFIIIQYIKINSGKKMAIEVMFFYSINNGEYNEKNNVFNGDGRASWRLQ